MSRNRLTKLYLIRGPIISVMALIIVVIGANIFDNSYQSVEYLLQKKSTIFSHTGILPNQFINSNVSSSDMNEHNVLIIHSMPASESVRLEGIDPNGMTFEKESKDGFLYHIIQKSNQGGNYSIKISNLGNLSVRIDAIMGEDPFLSKDCTEKYDGKCNVVWISIGFVIGGIISFIAGILIGIFDFRKETKLKKK